MKKFFVCIMLISLMGCSQTEKENSWVGLYILLSIADAASHCHR
jgi:hypothetical protein